MKIFQLPDILESNTNQEIQAFDYTSSTEIARQQIVLNKNAFSFLTEGSKEVFFHNSSFSIEHDQFLLMKSGHCLMTEKLSGANRHYASVLFFFSNQFIFNFIKKYKIAQVNLEKPYSVYSFTYDPFIKRFTKSLLDIVKLPQALQNTILPIKFEEIMLYLLEANGPSFLFAFMSAGDNQKQKFTQTIESNTLNKLSLKELAFLCNMSISKFKREFGEKYGMSPIKWFQNKRLEHALHLMQDFQKRPSDIYLEVGYESLSSFIQAYKGKYGYTPKQHPKK